MANWGEFIKEFKIVNLKSQGIFVKVDDVLDLFDERARLRQEIAQLKNAAPVAADTGAGAAEERERCARDIEEFAEACAAEPNQPEYVATVLRYAAELIRSRGQQAGAAEAVDDEAAALAAVEIPPAAEGIPTAEPVGEGVPTAEPVDEHAS